MTNDQPLNQAADQSILVVDDEEVMCRYCQRALQTFGYDVVFTTSSLVALDHLKQRHFDVLLADIRMPNLNGLELAREARKSQPDLAVIVMTGQTTMELLREAVQQGVTSYLSKPFEIEALRLTVAQVLSQRRVLLDNAHLQAIVHQLKLSQTFNSTLSLQDLCWHVMRAAHQEIRCLLGYFLIHTNNQPANLINSSNDNPPLNERGWHLLKETIQSQKITTTTLELGYRERPVVCFPLKTGDLIIGSVLFDYVPPLAPTTLNSLTLMLSQAAAALNNAQLYTSVQLANARLQELDHLKSEFISITSHELRTPLAVVIGYAVLLLEQNTGTQHEYLQRLLDGAQRINNIVDDMTHLRHLDHQATVLNLESVDLVKMVEQCVADMRELVDKKQQTVQIVNDCQAPATVQVDYAKIALAVMSLLSNAIKFSPVQGTITIKLDCVEVQNVPYQHELFEGLLAPGHWVLIGVIDSGIGITQAQQHRIFERFYQVSSSLTREQGGTGLGLALVRGLVDVHKGEVHVKSQEGVGSTFTIALPQELLAYSM